MLQQLPRLTVYQTLRNDAVQRLGMHARVFEHLQQMDFQVVRPLAAFNVPGDPVSRV